MKRYLVFFLACVFVLSLSACGMTETEPPNVEIPNLEIPNFDFLTTDPVADITEDAEATTQEVTAAPSETPTESPTEAPTEEDTTLGNYSVEIKGFRLASDYEGKPVIIITYGFTNVSDDDAAAFYLSVEATVYQNGVGLNEALFLNDDANYSSDNQTKELKKGASLDVEVAYELNDTSSDVEVEVKELFSFFDTKVLSKIFSIA